MLIKKEFFQSGHVFDSGYKNVRDLDHLVDLRKFVEELWAEFVDLADDHFLEDAKSHFQERFWEMYLAVSLLRRGYKVQSNKGRGPDIFVPLAEKRLQLEATVPGPGAGADAVPEMEMGVCNSVPSDEIVLRIRGAISAKLTQYQQSLSAGIVSITDPYVVAINGIRIRESRGEGAIPFILKAVFPFGDLNVVFDKEKSEIVDSHFAHRPVIHKQSGAEVRTDIFQVNEARSISAVLYAWCDCANHAEKLGEEYFLVHNPKAVNPIPHGTFKFGREYWAKDDEIISRNWNEESS